MDEIDDLQAQLKKARETILHATTAKEELAKKLASSKVSNTEAKHRGASNLHTDTSSDAEELRSKVFELEENLQVNYF